MDNRYKFTPVTEQDRIEFGSDIDGFEPGGISTDLRERWRCEAWRAFAKMMEELPSVERERWVALWAAGDVKQVDGGRGFSRPDGSLHRDHIVVEHHFEPPSGPKRVSIDPNMPVAGYLNGRPIMFADEHDPDV